jgi:hypothetical protein
MNRLFALALTVALFAALSACGGLHWVERQPVPPIAPQLVPPLHLFIPTPTVTPSDFPCARWHVWDCELRLREGEM